MDKISVFSDTINESFNYIEITWQGNTYLVDFNHRESLAKLIKAVTRESDLNEGIRRLPDELLEQTPYSKFQEESGNRNWVLYDKKQYSIIKCSDNRYIHYKGTSPKPPQPLNISSFDNLFLNNLASSLDLTEWDTSNVVTMHKTFYDCTHLTTLDVSSWDTSNVTDMSMMFTECRLLTSIDLKNWDVSNVKDMSAMFANALSLSSLDLSEWNVSSVTDVDNMFSSCERLSGINLANWDIRNLKGISAMFSSCTSMVAANLANWNTSGIEYIFEMFEGCSVLTRLDLRNWSAKYIEKVEDMFSGCDSLQTTNNRDLDKLLERDGN